ncbi:MAG: four helix bundle protein [Candidatus Aminicenantes bacterium]|nr:MAG: four helix bundle protein [Candidatus Aminicenantes bacterium]
MERATASVISNIAEGFSRQSDRELIQFLAISRSSVC